MAGILDFISSPALAPHEVAFYQIGDGVNNGADCALSIDGQPLRFRDPSIGTRILGYVSMIERTGTVADGTNDCVVFANYMQTGIRNYSAKPFIGYSEDDVADDVLPDNTPIVFTANRPDGLIIPVHVAWSAYLEKGKNVLVQGMRDDGLLCISGLIAAMKLTGSNRAHLLNG